MLYAEWYFTGQTVQADGATLGDHEKSAAEQWAKLGKSVRVIDRDAPTCPVELQYLWKTYQDIAAGVAIDDVGAPVITWNELAAWRDLTGSRLDPWECETIVDLSRVAKHIAAKALNERIKQK